MSSAATPPISPDLIAAWRGHIGRKEQRRQVLDVESLRRFAAAVGGDLDVEHRPPPLAHWAYFLETPTETALDLDGHPRRGPGILPPVSLPRRMFAASAMRFAEPLNLGAEAQLTLTVSDVVARSGKTGDLVFVEVDRVLTQGGRERVVERQTLVYREAGDALASPVPTDQPPCPGEEVWTPTSTALFRFSAATFNAHRIHYDQAYARDVEGYPDLVAHGPLTAARLASLAQRHHPAETLKSFNFRAHAPLFVNQPVRLTSGETQGEIVAIRCDKVLAMTARATF